MKPTEAIESGRLILDTVMLSAGFQFTSGISGKGSGGFFARASYTKDDRCMSFSYRWAIGEVVYQIGESSIEHKSYMRLLGVYRESKYPSFSRELPLAGFHALRHDLEKYCNDFLVGSGQEFHRLAMNRPK